MYSKNSALPFPPPFTPLCNHSSRTTPTGRFNPSPNPSSSSSSFARGVPPPPPPLEDIAVDYRNGNSSRTGFQGARKPGQAPPPPPEGPNVGSNYLAAGSVSSLSLSPIQGAVHSKFEQVSPAGLPPSEYDISKGEAYVGYFAQSGSGSINPRSMPMLASNTLGGNGNSASSSGALGNSLRGSTTLGPNSTPSSAQLLQMGNSLVSQSHAGSPPSPSFSYGGNAMSTRISSAPTKFDSLGPYSPTGNMSIRAGGTPPGALPPPAVIHPLLGGSGVGEASMNSVPSLYSPESPAGPSQISDSSLLVKLSPGGVQSPIEPCVHGGPVFVSGDMSSSSSNVAYALSHSSPSSNVAFSHPHSSPSFMDSKSFSMSNPPSSSPAIIYPTGGHPHMQTRGPAQFSDKNANQSVLDQGTYPQPTRAALSSPSNFQYSPGTSVLSSYNHQPLRGPQHAGGLAAESHTSPSPSRGLWGSVVSFEETNNRSVHSGSESSSGTILGGEDCGSSVYLGRNLDSNVGVAQYRVSRAASSSISPQNSRFASSNLGSSAIRNPRPAIVVPHGVSWGPGGSAIGSAAGLANNPIQNSASMDKFMPPSGGVEKIGFGAPFPGYHHNIPPFGFLPPNKAVADLGTNSSQVRYSSAGAAAYDPFIGSMHALSADHDEDRSRSQLLPQNPNIFGTQSSSADAQLMEGFSNGPPSNSQPDGSMVVDRMMMRGGDSQNHSDLMNPVATLLNEQKARSITYNRLGPSTSFSSTSPDEAAMNQQPQSQLPQSRLPQIQLQKEKSIDPKRLELMKQLTQLNAINETNNAHGAEYSWYYLDLQQQPDTPLRRSDESTFSPIDNGTRLEATAKKLLYAAKITSIMDFSSNIYDSSRSTKSSLKPLSLEAKVHNAHIALAPLFDMAKKQQQKSMPFGPDVVKRKKVNINK